MAGCAHCGTTLEVVANLVGRRDVCPSCGEDLRSCRNCRHFDPGVAKACKEPFAEVPSDKDAGNFCDLFQLGDGGTGARARKEEALAAAEALFRKR